MGRIKDLEKQCFGKLTVLGFPANIENQRNHKNGNMQWVTECACGNISIMDGYVLRKGDAKTCGKSCISSNINHFFLDTIDEQQAYFLGLAYADGCVFNKHSFSIDCKAEYKKILDELISWFNLPNELYEYHKKQSNYYRLRFTSQRIIEQMQKFDVVPNKTYISSTFMFLDSFSDNLLGYWLLGLIMGDGYVSSSDYKIRITGHNSSIIPLFNYLDSRFPNEFSVLSDKRKPVSYLNLLASARQRWVYDWITQEYVTGINHKMNQLGGFNV